MDPDRRRVDLVRVPREEKYYDAEDVLGRDIASVFPTESKKAALETDAAKAILQQGNKKFISETELAEIKAVTGGRGRVEDGSIAADKPLAEILREQREAKEAQKQEQWKQMKIGKNRPLDEDELEFLDNIAEAEAARRQREADEEAAELDMFHRALKEREEAEAKAKAEAEAAAAEVEEKKGAAAAAAAAAAVKQKSYQSGPGVTARMMVKPKIGAIVKPKRNSDDHNSAAAAAAAKKQKIESAAEEEDEQESSQGEGGLAGLLGDYGSDSD